jgi:hypothetical protein
MDCLEAGTIVDLDDFYGSMVDLWPANLAKQRI